MAEFVLSKEDYIEWLSYKRERLLMQLKEVEEKIKEATTNGHVSKLIPPAHPGASNLKQYQPKQESNSTRFAGWRYYVDEVLKNASDYLYTYQVVELVKKYPELKEKQTVAKKSVGSALSMNSTEDNKRYLWKKDQKGIKMYAFNPDYK